MSTPTMTSIDAPGAPAGAPSGARSVHRAFEAQVARAPHQLAVVYPSREPGQPDERVTYRELDDRARRLAQRLRSLGVRRGRRVAILAEPSVDLVVGLIAILKAGGSYLPLDVQAPPDRLGFMLADAQAAWLLAPSRLLPIASSLGVPVTLLDASEACGPAEPAPDPADESGPDDLIYVMYTSGSTGVPKGVAIRHGAVLRLVHDQDYIAIRPDDRIAQASTVAFDASTFEIWGALLNGATLVGVSRETLLAPRELAARLRECEISVLFLTTALLNQVAAVTPDALRTLRVVLFGGEAVSPRSVAEVLARGAPQELLHVYGPTETTTFATWYRVTEVPADATTLPIGRAIGGTQTHVLDEARRPVEPGATGELYIGGAGLAEGYLNRADLTAERFVEAAWDRNLRLYRTGDRVRRLADGNIEFVGRTDNQVKLRGFRIELGEIEEALAAEPGVRQVVAHVHEDASGEKTLVAYVVPQDPQATSTSAWRERLRARLPGYMVPQSFVTLAALPLNANGKVDRHALPPPHPVPDETRDAVAPDSAPRTPTQRALAGIWSRVLHQRVDDIHAHFFDRGGHSLLAVQAMAAVERELRLILPVSQFFALPTLDAQARWLDEHAIEADADAPSSAVPASRLGARPLTFPQRQLWLFEQLHPSQAVYNETLVFHLPERIDPDRIAEALDRLVERHEALRTTFTVVDGEPCQVIHEPRPVELRRIDLETLPETERLPAAHAQATAELTAPFDLEHGPLFRALLATFTDTDWRLYLSAHHLILDGVSIYGVFLPELEAAYRARCDGREPVWMPLPAQPADVAVWQQRELGEAVLAGQLAYWRQQLADLPQLQLPTDRPATAKASYRGDRQCLHLPAGLSRQLKDLSRAEGVTLFVTLAAAINVLLHRYTGQDDIVLGTVHSGRSRWAWQRTLGNFLNNLVLRTSVAGDPSFRTLLARVKAVLADAYRHPDVPFEQLVQALRPERLPFRNPLFQVAFVMEPPLPDGETVWGLSQLEIHSGTSKFDLLIELDDRADGIVGRVEYSTELFDPATITRFIGHLQTLLEGIVADPRQLVSQLPLLPAAELQLLQRWNDTAVDYPRAACLHRLFEAQVARTPQGVALVHGSSTLTYAELDVRANQLAHRLQRLGVGPDTLVAVCLERSIEMVVALYGILKAGGAYLPIDPAYPPERQAFMLDDAQVTVLLTQRSLAGRGAASGATSLYLDEEWLSGALAEGEALRCAECPTHAPSSPVTLDHLAYAIYTSGSTGQPKGALIPHRGICNRLQWMQAAYPLAADDVVLQKTPFSFDVSVWEFFWPLLFGARLVVARHEGHKDTEYLCEVIEQQRVTTLHFVPSMLQLFLETADAGRCRSLRRVMCSGEALPHAVQQAFFARFPVPVELHNLYGPTEASVDVSYWACERDSPRTTVPIGRPIANIHLHILDARRQPVPIGVPGELHIGGVGVGRGYLNRPALTAERFVDVTLPATGVPTRLYRTGDLCRWLPDGTIEYLGRLDHQVKVRGLRIELGEIESALRRCAAFREVVVVVREDRPGDRRLVAYGVPQGAAEPDAEALRRALGAQLPEYMVPSAFVTMPALPLSANGKLDRRALPAPERARSGSGGGFVAPRSPVETRLARLWAEILDLDAVGIHDSFFDLGGDSMRAIRVVAAARRDGLDLSVAQLFQHPTVAALAERCLADRTAERDDAPVEPSLRAFELLSDDDRRRLPAGLDDAYPLSTLQAGMVYHTEAEPGTDVYHDLMGSRVGLPLKMDVLRDVLRQLIVRHPLLRTRVALRGYSQPLQLVQRGIEPPIVLDDLRHLGDDAQEAVIDAWFVSEKRRTFDWEAAPPWRVQVHHRGPACFNLTLSFHHILLEGWSIASFLAELFGLYLNALGRSDRTLPPPPVSRFRDFIAHERRVVQSAEARAHWQRRVSDTPLAKLPRWPRAWRDACPPGVVDLAVDPALSERLRGFARNAGVPLKSVLLAAHLRALRLQVGQPHVTAGLVTNIRPATADAERVLGLYLNTLPFGLALTGGSWTELVQAVFRQEQEDIVHRDYPLAEIQRHAGRPLFESIFNIVHFHVYQDLLRHEGLTGINTKVFQRTNFPLLSSFVLHPRTALLERIVMDYDGAEVCREQAEVIGGSVLEILSRMCEAPEARYETVALASAAAPAPAVAAEPVSGGLHTLFEAQVDRTPEAIALVAPVHGGAAGESVCLSYRELDARANRLARHLLWRGVGAQTPVGLCLERSADMVVALLAILKAGAAYLPVDRRHPTARRLAMLADAGVRWMVTGRDVPDDLSGWTGQTLCIEREHAAIARQPATRPDISTRGDQLAYVLYTSGSTGVPKGIAIEHRQTVHLMRWAIETYSADELAGVLASTSLSFDLSVFEIFAPLCRGGRVIVAEDILQLPALAAREQVTLVNTVPSAMTPGWVAQMPASVCVVNLAGESLREAVAQRIHARSTRVKLYNLYGPTETTTYATAALIPRGCPNGITIGRPIPGTEIQILDENRLPVPVGVPGEIHIGGAGLARGYLNRPELDRERFIAHPFRPGGTERLYVSGDRGHWMPDGSIEFLGRLDRQIKLRGLRIELPEIEAVLLRHPAVEEAVVVVRGDERGEASLAAYLVASGVGEGLAAEGRALLKQHLPGCMVPNSFTVLDRLPLTVNGKVDAAALPRPSRARDVGPQAFVPPRTRRERELAALWAELLSLDRVGVHDDFFELGGHSLLAMEMIARAGLRGWVLSLPQLTREPTIAGLVRALEAQEPAPRWSVAAG